MTAAVAVAYGVVLALLALLVFGLLRSHAEILRRLHELDGGEAGGGPVRRSTDPGPAPDRTVVGGTAVPDVVGVTLDGDPVSIATGDVDHDTLLVFLSSGCLTCQAFWSAFGSREGVSIPSGTRLVIVSKDLDAESPSELAALAPPGVDLVASSAAWTDYQVPGSPYVVAVHGPESRIQGEGTGLSWEQVAGLLAQATGDRAYLGTATAASTAKPLSDQAREARVDEELLRAGVLPGDPSLYPGEAPTDPSRGS